MTYFPKCHYLVMVVLIIFTARAMGQNSHTKNDTGIFGAGTNSSKLVSILPVEGAVFRMDGKARPQFKWKWIGNKPKGEITYTLTLYYHSESGEKKTYSYSPGCCSYDKSDWDSLIKEPFVCSWHVTAKNAAGQVVGKTGLNYFSFISPNYNVKVTLDSIWCDKDSLNVFDFKASIQNTGNTPLTFHPSTDAYFVDPVFFQNDFTVSEIITSPTIPTPLLVTGPALTITGQFHFTGTPYSPVILLGQGSPAVGPTPTGFGSDSLPNCNCTYCDDSMHITAGAQNASFFAPNMATIQQQFFVSPLNIIKITASIVYVKDSVTSEDCRICAPNENEVFQFVNTNTATGFGSPIAINPTYYGSSSTTSPSKVVTWISGAGGVNIAFPNSVQLDLHVGLPTVSTLDCCNQWETICIRYTFWDVECKACDLLVCYKLKRK